MKFKDWLIDWLRSFTNRGIRLSTRIVWALTLVAFVGAVYLTFTWRLTDSSLTLKFEKIPDSDVPGFSDDLLMERELVEGMGREESAFPTQTVRPLSGSPILYAYVAYVMSDASRSTGMTGAGLRILALFNVLCTLVAMVIVHRIAIRIWKARLALGSTTALLAGDLRSLYRAGKEGGEASRADEPVGEPASDGAVEGAAEHPEVNTSLAETPVTIGLFALVVMCLHTFNPIVFSEAIRPSPRPLAYLLALIAFLFSLRALEGKAIPKWRCVILTLAAGLVHVPAALIAVPMVLLGLFGGSVQRLKRRTLLQRLALKGRGMIIVGGVAALIPIAATLLSSIDATRLPLRAFFEDNLPPALFASIVSWIVYFKTVLNKLGMVLVSYAPQIAALSMVPIPSMKGLVERAMLVYAVGLFAFFTLLFPAGELAQFYPIMFPLAIIAGIGIVNTINVYIDNALAELAALWIRFFGTLGSVPFIGTGLIWITKEFESIQQQYEFVTPYTIGLLAIALLGLYWQIRKRFRNRAAKASSER